MESIPDDPGRRGAVAIILRGSGAVQNVGPPKGDSPIFVDAKIGTVPGPQMLVIRRSRHVVAPLTYCFPGGGIEDGETERSALVREVGEELGVAIIPQRRLWHCVTAWKVDLAWWLAAMDPAETPTPNPAEVESIHWVTAEEMARLPGLLDSNRIFLEHVAAGRIRLEE